VPSAPLYYGPKPGPGLSPDGAGPSVVPLGAFPPLIYAKTGPQPQSGKIYPVAGPPVPSSAAFELACLSGGLALPFSRLSPGDS
jgi:hypothetical protein